MCDQSVIIKTLRTVARFYNLRQHTPPLNQGSTDPPAELWFNREDFNFRCNQLVGFLQLSPDPVHHCRGGHGALGVHSTRCCCQTDGHCMAPKGSALHQQPLRPLFFWKAQVKWVFLLQRKSYRSFFLWCSLLFFKMQPGAYGSV